MPSEAGARALAAELGFLPLALALAAAVIAERRLTVGTYLDRLRGYPVEQYLPRAKGDPYPRGVAEAIGLSIDTVMAEDPTGTCDAVLGVVSLLSPDGVSTRLLEGGWGRRLLGGGCGRWLLEGGSGRIPVPWVRAHAAWRSARSLLRGKRNSTDPWAYDGVGRAGVEQALGRLTDASLLTFSGDGSTVLAHRLVARTVRERLKREGRLATVGAIARDLLLSNEVILHMQKISGNAPAYDRAADRDFARQAAALAAFLGPSARLGGKRKAQRALHSWAEAYEVLGESPDDAIARAAKQVSGCVRAHGEQHATTLDARISLAEAYLESAQRAEAIEQLETVYAVRRQVLGETAPGTVAAAGQLSGLYVSAGRLNEAAPLAALWLRRQHALGRTDASGNDIYLRTGYETAERAREEIPVHEMYVSVFAPVVGDADLHTIQFRINLAAAYRTVGRTDDAIGQYTRALAGLETAWGPENEVTIELRDLLAIVRQEAGERGSAPPD